ncbi:MAG TPA: LacI family DNA-binding transcriptional regulator [Piscinibacter sp.]|nr:MAG: LacI family transcriptional regulator [Burkholderiaceae bacterium]HNK17023.1 LacI family DNA-binding transcriptional regulator [Piscinibacter sp.]
MSSKPPRASKSARSSPASEGAASITAVAALAGVSIATVSRVLNRSKPVNAETRERVEAAVAQLGYQANPFARSLTSGESRLILVLVPGFANPFFAEIVQGVESVTSRSGYNIVLSVLPDGAPLDPVYRRLIDGVISMAHVQDPEALVGAGRELPWVACSEFMPDSGVPYVSIDHRQAAVDAVQYLLNRGHRRIALLHAHEDYAWAQQRRAGYEIALTRAGVALDPALIRVARGTDYADGIEATGGLLSLQAPPTALFAVSDTLAIGAIKAFRRAGRRVPDDVAIVGFDNVPLSEVFEPSLTTIAQPMRELGATAAELLLERLAGGSPQPRTLAHTLVVRESG